MRLNLLLVGLVFDVGYSPLTSENARSLDLITACILYKLVSIAL